jgi:ATP synthase protein I
VSPDRFSREIDDSARKLLRARADRRVVWRHAALLGVGGWLFVIPVVGGAYLGRYLDRRHAGGQSWTLTLILLGLAVGVYNFWLYYHRRS